MTPPVVLLHGIATTASIWDRVIAALGELGLRDVTAIRRPCTGSLSAELRALEPQVEGALVVGQSGGATLALALAASRTELAGAVAHEPAVGSLLPELLTPVARAYAEHGVEGLGATLYGPTWSAAMAHDHTVIPGELAMFRSFEPSRARAGQGPVLVTVGAASPPIRHDAASALHDRLGYEIEPLTGASHFVAWDAPEVFAAAIAAHAQNCRSESPAFRAGRR
ncbi:alpha/beta fold hydrolase [Microbacterium allomyrinae]|uniref:Alpha/beta hydrolase n=1 Tax=Microbacterium allomyrinae TaxID=2830666 RepID=A0A9X1LX08_9MICO|nr:alpha/beta hydrolase [Microbacterium allomyrinae]MCC2033203.1 alpha/beta hydrolase [Microbacterium allomyrinae]